METLRPEFTLISFAREPEIARRLDGGGVTVEAAMRWRQICVEVDGRQILAFILRWFIISFNGQARLIAP